MPDPAIGDIWTGDLSLIIGHDKAGQRPLLVVSIDRFNRSGAGLVVVAPVTSTLRNVPWHVSVSPPEGGLNTSERDPLRGSSIDQPGQAGATAWRGEPINLTGCAKPPSRAA